MTKQLDLIARDLQHIWHPCSQMKDYESFPPLVVTRANGSYIELSDGRKIIDAISSWWCKSLGHNHPILKAALIQQLDQFEHVILANTTNENIVKLGEKLSQLCPGLDKVLFASDGSCAVEIALKMSLHARLLQGQQQRTRFIALCNAYHGETVGAMSVSDVGLYNEPYRKLLFETSFITDLPYVSGVSDPLWSNCESHWQVIEKQLEPYAADTTALIIEPLVQGAAGMLIYSPDLLKRLRQWTHQHGIHLIADEIMTGMGRTGKMLACEHAAITPDFIILSKGLTAGFLPMSVVITSQTIYDLFYSDYALQKSFLHSHTFSGNALAVSVALATFTCFEQEKIIERMPHLTQTLLSHMQDIAQKTGKLGNIRGIGGIVAADLITKKSMPRAGYHVYQQAMKLGALLRPIANTIYWLPPLNITDETLNELRIITENALIDIDTSR